MQSILEVIRTLRGEETLHIDRNNSNRYRVIMNEKDGTKTSYYFSTPVYNIHTGNVVDFKFKSCGNALYANGSNTKTFIKDRVFMEGPKGNCAISLAGEQLAICEQEVLYNNFVLLPTTNGVAYKVFVDGMQSVDFEIEVNIPFLSVRANNKYFAFMQAKFLPYVTVSCIGTFDETGQGIAPALIEYEKINERKYRLTVSSCSTLAKSVLFEVNMYEQKLIQDTTVESGNPQMNNAFGSTAFIGRTREFGEQWLYARPDFSKISELAEQRQTGVMFHLPQYRANGDSIDLFQVISRFCSFGSNWENKITASNRMAGSAQTDQYLSFDITALVGEQQKNYFVRSEGFVLKPAAKTESATVVATGDSYYNPQILEINYK